MYVSTHTHQDHTYSNNDKVKKKKCYMGLERKHNHGAGKEMQSARCWLCKQEDLCVNSKTHILKNPGIVAHFCNSTLGSRDRWFPGACRLVSLACFANPSHWEIVSLIVPKEWCMRLFSGFYVHMHTCKHTHTHKSHHYITNTILTSC